MCSLKHVMGLDMQFVKGAGFDVAFRPDTTSPKRPVYAIRPKLCARRLDFSSAVHRRVLFPSAFPNALLRMVNFEMTRAASPVGSRLTTQAKKKLIATHANSEIAANHSQHTTSHFLIATVNRFPQSPGTTWSTANGRLSLVTYHKSQLVTHSPLATPRPVPNGSGEFLTATVAKLKSHLSPSQHWTSYFSNRNRIAVSGIALLRPFNFQASTFNPQRPSLSSAMSCRFVTMECT